MAKRKVLDSEEEEETKPSKNLKQKNKTPKEESDSDFDVKREEVEEEEDELLEDDEPLNKKTKRAAEKKTKADQSSDEPTVKTSSEGDKYIDLGKKKRATVRSFKGTPLLDIREFYGSEGDEKPGKKGISLTLDQWDTLKTNATTLDELFAKLKKK